MSIGMQFEKKEDVGYCGKLSGVMESGLFAESTGKKGEYQSWKTEVNIGVLPENKSFFQTACEMTSRWCIIAGPVSANKTNVYYSFRLPHILAMRFDLPSAILSVA